MHTIEISDDLGKRLSALVERTDRSESSYTEQALEQLLEDQEDLMLALSRRSHDKHENISLGDLEKELGLVDGNLAR